MIAVIRRGGNDLDRCTIIICSILIAGEDIAECKPRWLWSFAVILKLCDGIHVALPATLSKTPVSFCSGKRNGAGIVSKGTRGHKEAQQYQRTPPHCDLQMRPHFAV